MQASIAPNPAMNVAKVFFSNPKAGMVRFAICSLQGQVVMSKTGYFGEGERQFELQLGGLAKGFYLLRIEGKGGCYETVKLQIKYKHPESLWSRLARTGLRSKPKPMRKNMPSRPAKMASLSLHPKIIASSPTPCQTQTTSSSSDISSPMPSPNDSGHTNHIYYPSFFNFVVYKSILYN